MFRLLYLFSTTLLVVFLCTTTASIHRELRATFDTQPSANVFVVMKEGTTKARRVAAKSTNASRGENIAAIRDSLKLHSQQAQQSVFDQLSAKPRPLDLKTQSLWITNEIYIEGATLDLVEELHQLDSVSEIYQDTLIPLLEIMNPDDAQEHESDEAVEWGVEYVGAPKVWAAGCRGEGIKIGSIDTGVQWDHEALRENYVARDDRTKYGWLNPGNRSSLEPSDSNGHGTHTTGTMVGGKGIGVAPGAEWMACQACTFFGCNQISLKVCGQFMLCPHDPQNEDLSDCSLAPDIVSNSWAGKQGEVFFDPIIEAWRDADIIPVFAMGNDGKNGCGSANSPGDNPNVIAVGATTIENKIADFSSRGPPVRDSSLIKPEVVAPGDDILSAWPSSTKERYLLFSGTSMACPHVSGIIALILSENPNATYDDVYQILTTTSTTSTLQPDADVCGDLASTTFPNFVYGNGFVDAFKCWKQVQSL